MLLDNTQEFCFILFVFLDWYVHACQYLKLQPVIMKTPQLQSFYHFLWISFLAVDYHTSRSVDVRGDAYVRSSRYRRPTSAYGYVSSRYTTRDIEVFPSPLPPRSTTSLGRSAFVEHVRSPDREFSRMHRSPMRRANPSYTPYSTMSPDPFRYEPIKASRPEVSQLEAQLDSLKREKRRLEKQYNATQTASTLTDNLRRREELVRMSRTYQHHSEMTHYS